MQTPTGGTQLKADIADREGVRRVIQGLHFDAVVDFVAFAPEDIERDLEIFRGHTNQYFFISSASAYQKPPVHYIITESTPLSQSLLGLFTQQDCLRGTADESLS